MGRPAATEAERAEQRRRIRRAAAAIYQEGGLPAMSVRAIAKRAEVSTGLLYSYYANLSDLMRTLWMGPIIELGRSLAEIEDAQPDPVRRIEELLFAYVDFAGRHPDVHRGLLLFVRPPSSPTPTRAAPDGLQLHAALRRAVQAGQAAQRVRPGDPTELAQLVWAGVHGALALPVNVDSYELEDPARLAAAMIRTLLTSITTNTSADTSADISADAPEGTPT